MAESDGEDTFRKRLEKLRKALEFDGWDPMAEKLRLLPDVSTQANHMSGWKKAPGPKLMMALAMLHPLDPRGCLEWLHEGGEMPRLHVDRNEQGSDVHQPGVNHARDLEVISAIQRLGLEVAGILKRDDGPPPEGTPTRERGPKPTGGIIGPIEQIDAAGKEKGKKGKG